MELIPIPRDVFEQIKAAAREEVYDAMFRHSGVETSDEALNGWLDTVPPESLGVRLVETASWSVNAKPSLSSNRSGKSWSIGSG